MIKAEIIADSVSPQDKRITTFSLEYPRFIHAEFMTHRMISRNASSSRALPPGKLAQEALGENRAVPVVWGSERRGMQVGDELQGVYLQDAKYQWQEAARAAVKWAAAMTETGVHKSISNRLLEPFTHIRVVTTATEWDNFFGLRLDGAAEPTMHALAEAMWKAMQASEPKPLLPGQWHLPYIEPLDYDDAYEFAGKIRMGVSLTSSTDVLLRVSVARCARVSYKSFESGITSTIAEDLALYDKLLGAQPLHASPAEHQASPDELDETGEYKDPGSWGNLVGWKQYRKMLIGEKCAPLPVEYR